MLKPKKGIIKILCIACACTLICLSFTCCSSRSKKTLLSYEDKEMNVGTYEFLLTRMKGTLEGYGYDVYKETFWNTIISSDGLTYNDYFKTAVLEQAYNYLISDYLFEKEGLTLSDYDKDTVNKLMEALEKNAGSKNNLNAELSKCGINSKMLKEIYTTEVKINLLKEFYFGESGEKISEETKQQYLKDNYVCFKQIFIASYYYQTLTDNAGDSVYFTNDKAEKIAYDKENGHTEKDEYGSEIKDKFGDAVYYDENGKVAYDKKNGVVSYVKDKDGNKISEFYSTEEKAALRDLADKYASEATDYEKFEAMREKYDESETGNTRLYLAANSGYYETQASSAAYLDKIASELKKMNVGECSVVDSDYGYHIIMKYETEDRAYEKEEYKDIFESFISDLVSRLYTEKCGEYNDKVTFDSDIWKECYDMNDVASNKLY